MLAQVFLAALVGTAAAVPPSIPPGEWYIRADWSRCPDYDKYEAILFPPVKTINKISSDIYEFRVPSGVSLNTSLILKPTGAVGLGSPYGPKKIDFILRQKPDIYGNLGVARYTPSGAPGNSDPGVTIAQVAWFSRENDATSPAAEIGFDGLRGDMPLMIGTSQAPSYARVYYCFGTTPVGPPSTN